MKQILLIIVLTTHLLDMVMNSPIEDDGIYRPKKFRNDGKYYRPPQEGKYVHTDDGKYLYIYQKGIYPIDEGDYRYIHVEGPRGPDGPDHSPGGLDGFGGGEGSGGFEGSGDGDGSIGPSGLNGLDGPGGLQGPVGPDGHDGSNGPDGPNGSDGPDGPNGLGSKWYFGMPKYTEKYPYINKIVISLADQYASNNTLNYLYGDKSEESINYYKELRADNATAVKCHSLYPERNITVKINKSPEQQLMEEDDYVGTYYRFSGTKCVKTVSSLTNAKTTLKLHYEVFVKVIDEFSEPAIEIEPIDG